MMSDFPKIECPFIRKLFKVDKKDFEKHGRELQLREPEVYLVTDEVNPGCEWVFDDPDTIAIEKLNGTNVKLKTENGRLIALQNRKNVIDPNVTILILMAMGLNDIPYKYNLYHS